MKLRHSGGGEEAQRRGQQVTDVVEGPRARRAEERLQFGEGQFDRIEVGTVGRQKAQVRADLFDGGADCGLFVHREVIGTTTSPGRSVGTKTCST